MSDILFIVLTIVLFAIAIAYVRGCERI